MKLIQLDSTTFINPWKVNYVIGHKTGCQIGFGPKSTTNNGIDIEDCSEIYMYDSAKNIVEKINRALQNQNEESI